MMIIPHMLRITTVCGTLLLWSSAWARSFINDPQASSYFSTHSPGSFYWHGTDKDKNPILWYDADKISFRSANVKKEIKKCEYVMQAVLDSMPSDMHALYFVICFDKFDLANALKKPNLVPAFIKLFIRICPPNRLKKAYFVTGTIGNMFYKLANALAPNNIMDKVVKVRSREDAVALMVKDGLLTDINIPTFMGGKHNHDEAITTDYKMMIETITKEMNASRQ